LQYELVAAILHYGDGFSGHYVAMVKDRARGRWMVANDETVRVATQEDYSTSNAYMCFYQRKPLPIDIYVRSLF
jgi:ubiquitin C-terminal hydrolase